MQSKTKRINENLGFDMTTRISPYSKDLRLEKKEVKCLRCDETFQGKKNVRICLSCKSLNKKELTYDGVYS